VGKKSLALGFGAGVMAVAALCYFVYGIQKNATAASYNKTIAKLTAEAAALREAASSSPAPGASAAAELGPEKGGEPPAPVLPDETPEAAAPEETEAEPPEAAKPVHVEIPKGLSSQKISEMLENSGVVDDAKEFERFLYAEGVTRVIPWGVFDIPPGLSYGEVLGALKGR
jgi:hypothetical protein